MNDTITFALLLFADFSLLFWSVRNRREDRERAADILRVFAIGFALATGWLIANFVRDGHL